MLKSHPRRRSALGARLAALAALAACVMISGTALATHEIPNQCSGWDGDLNACRSYRMGGGGFWDTSTSSFDVISIEEPRYTLWCRNNGGTWEDCFSGETGCEEKIVHRMDRYENMCNRDNAARRLRLEECANQGLETLATAVDCPDGPSQPTAIDCGMLGSGNSQDVGNGEWTDCTVTGPGPQDPAALASAGGGVINHTGCCLLYEENEFQLKGSQGMTHTFLANEYWLEDFLTQYHLRAYGCTKPDVPSGKEVWIGRCRLATEDIIIEGMSNGSDQPTNPDRGGTAGWCSVRTGPPGADGSATGLFADIQKVQELLGEPKTRAVCEQAEDEFYEFCMGEGAGSGSGGGGALSGYFMGHSMGSIAPAVYATPVYTFAAAAAFPGVTYSGRYENPWEVKNNCDPIPWVTQHGLAVALLGEAAGLGPGGTNGTTPYRDCAEVKQRYEQQYGASLPDTWTPYHCIDWTGTTPFLDINFKGALRGGPLGPGDCGCMDTQYWIERYDGSCGAGTECTQAAWCSGFEGYNPNPPSFGFNQEYTGRSGFQPSECESLDALYDQVKDCWKNNSLAIGAGGLAGALGNCIVTIILNGSAAATYMQDHGFDQEDYGKSGRYRAIQGPNWGIPRSYWAEATWRYECTDDEDCGGGMGSSACCIGNWCANENCPPVCGDGMCNGTETCSTCADDCGSCCGNGTCDNGEDSATCPEDCGGGGSGSGSGACGDGFCDDLGGEDSGTCPSDCYCGDGFCDVAEDCSVCDLDCGGCGGGSGSGSGF